MISVFQELVCPSRRGEKESKRTIGRVLERGEGREEEKDGWTSVLEAAGRVAFDVHGMTRRIDRLEGRRIS